RIQGAIAVLVVYALGVEVAFRIVHGAQQETGEAVAGGGALRRQGCFAVEEAEAAVSQRLVGRILERAAAMPQSSELPGMLAAIPAQRVVEFVGVILLRADVLGVVPKGRQTVAEIDDRKTGSVTGHDTGQAKLLRPARTLLGQLLKHIPIAAEAEARVVQDCGREGE